MKKLIVNHCSCKELCKSIRVMKISVLFLFMSIGLLSAKSTYSQETKMSLKMERKTLRDVIAEIEKSTEYIFLYDDKDINLNAEINLSAKNESVEKILNKALGSKNYKHKVNGRQIIIYGDESVLTKGSISSQIQQSEIKVIGQIKDQTGEPLIGVSVVDELSKKGTITDIDGKFELKIEPDSYIVCSYIGFQNLKIQIKDATPLNITMNELDNILDEVVVVAFGTQKKVNLTGAVTSVDSKELTARPINSAIEALQGVVPGLNISTGSGGGALNSNKSFNIRGTGTIGSGAKSEPLVLIDGMEGDINSINPQDIENISVLKDAAASSIYGSRAPAGVILITTKRGSANNAGKPVINYNDNFRFSSPLNMPKMANSYEFANYFNDADPNGTMFTDSKLQAMKDYMNGTKKDYMYPNSNGRWEVWDGADILPNANTDWMKEHFGNSFTQEHSLSVSGGSDKHQYYFSGNFLDQGGLLRHGDDNKQRYSLNAKINSQLTKYLSASYNIRFVRSDYDAPSYLGDAFYHDVARYWPIIPVKDPNGHYLAESKVDLLTNGGRFQTQNDQINHQVAFNLEFIKNWKINAELNYRSQTDFQHTDWQTVYSYDVADNPFVSGNTTSSIKEYAYKSNYFNPNIFSEYSHEFQSGHNIKVMGGFQSEYLKQNKFTAQRDGIIAGIPNLNATTTNPLVSGEAKDWATAGFFGRVNYDYKGRYLVEGNIRYDGSSRYIRDQRWNVFPSFSLGWNIARESFWEPYTDVMSNFKIRGSWGELGNQNTDNWYPFYRIVNLEQNKGEWLINGMKPNIASEGPLVSSSLSWERIRSWNIGLDASALKNRLNLTFDYFQRQTLDMVGPAPELPVILGIEVPKTNNLDMVARGWEIAINWRDQIKDFRYGATLTLADDEVKIQRYPNDGKVLDRNYYPGSFLGDIWGYTTLGIAQTKEEMDAHLAKVDQSALGTNWGAGDIMYADLDGDGKVDGGEGTAFKPGDRRIIGNKNPRYKVGLNLDAAWKGFDIKILFQGVLKRDYAPGGALFWGADGGKWQSVAYKEHLDYFRPEADHNLGVNLNSYYPRADWDSDKNRKTQTRYLQNAAYLRLKNVTLGYTLPKSTVRSLYISNLRIFVSGENLLTMTSLTKLFDPETLGLGWSDGKTYPLQQTFSCGLSATF